MTRRKTKTRATTHPSECEDENCCPSPNMRITDNQTIDKLESYLEDPTLLIGLTIEEYLELNDILFDLDDEPRKKFKVLFKYVSKYLKTEVKTLKTNNKLDKISEAITVVKDNMNSMSSEINKISQQVDSSRPPQTIPQLSYSQALASRPIASPSSDQLKTIIIKSSNPDSVPPKVVESKVKSIINESNIKAKIVRISTNKSSVVIKSAEQKSENLSLLVQKINQHSSNRNSFKAFIPNKMDPTIIMKGVSIDNNLTTIINQITENNPLLENINNEIKFLFRIKTRNPNQMDIVFRVSPRVFDIISKKMNNNVYIDFQCCKTEHQTFVRQCQKCFQFNHKANECRNHMICKNCGQTKNSSHHCHPEHQTCVNCKNSNIFKNDVNHLPNSQQCPIYKSRMKQIIEQTQFHPTE
ncbi:hypothetical protein QR98_0036500 [Sarcoptes scabiei]|uniref:Uncharacterized protein n=1 Tax=Sarcoptes scabiei TaxID=52283 RepID=A0A132A2M4_SARSC|nr:hypothetical protein QR98_0036500 [Sarcoptes scabiei]